MPKLTLKCALICSLLFGAGCSFAAEIEPDSTTKERIETPPVGNGEPVSPVWNCSHKERIETLPVGKGGLARCVLYFRDDTKPENGGAAEDRSFASQEMLIHPGERKSVSLEFLELHASYSFSPIDSGAFHLRAKTNEATLFSTLFQFSASEGLINQFGWHGFTGLMYLTHPTNGGNYQAWCRWVFKDGLDEEYLHYPLDH